MALLHMPVSQIQFPDLRSFFDTDPPQTEGIHLEFKSREIGNDKLADAIAAFANTRGGWIFLGIEEIGEKSGKALWPPKGIDYDANYGDRIDHIVQDRVFPYLSIEVKPIQFLDDPTRMVAVIRIPESESAPHYTHDENGGAKVYVRREAGKDKKPWDNLLARENELERLMNRRANIHQMREDFIARSIRRIESTGMKQSGSPLLIISIIPIFPVTPIFEYENLRAIVENNLPEFKKTSNLPVMPETVGRTRVTQMDSHLWISENRLRFLLEVSRFGHVTLSCRPIWEPSQNATWVITMQYLIYPIIWSILFNTKVCSHKIRYLLRIRLDDFKNWDFDSNLVPAFWGAPTGCMKKLDKIDDSIVFDEEYIPNNDKVAILEMAERIVSHLAWVMDLHDYTDNFKVVAKGYIEAGYQSIEEEI